jgi:trans-2,3-dihydro-3-hydroxyanthranilate isomerase
VPHRYLHYDVFTREALRGNQLAVFPDARGLDDRAMQAIARELNFSESTFVLPAERGDTDVRMRIFTPSTELPIAGHPTIGSAFALAETGAIAQGAGRFVFGLGVGPVSVDLEWEGGRLRFAWMTQPNPEFGPVVDDRAAVAESLGVGVRDLTDDPIQMVSCGVPYLLVPLRDREAVDRAIPDAAAARRLSSVIGVEWPMYLFARTGEAAIYSRMFATLFGIAEDPATGSACGPVGSYLVHHGLLSTEAASNLVNDQGVAMGRASRIHIDISADRRAVSRVRVGGEAVLVARGELLVTFDQSTGMSVPT